MKKPLPLVLLILVLVSNALWFLLYERKKDSLDYAGTLICDLENLSKLKDLYAVGINSTEFFNSCEKNNHKCQAMSDKIQLTLREQCPASGRPFCGYLASFKNGSLEQINSGYPCH